MPDAPRPPVNEVVHSVAFSPQSALSGPRLPSILGDDWFGSHERVETAPAYEIPPEVPDLAAALQVPRIQFRAIPATPRYWLISSDDQELIQVQPDYLALNWRRRGDDNTYPGYGIMSSRFIDLLETVSDGLVRHQGLLKPTRAELTYINIIHPDNLWSSLADTHRLLNITLPTGASYERLSFSYAQPLTTSSGEFGGRLHVDLAPAVDWIKQEPQLNLTLTARSADFTQQGLEFVQEFINTAHSAIERAFLNLIKQDVLSAWGLA